MLTQSLTQAVFWFAVASTVSAASYLLIFWLRRAAPDSVTAVAAIAFIFFFVTYWANPFGFIFYLMCFASCIPFCLAGAFAERKVSLVKSSFEGHFVALFCATGFSWSVAYLSSLYSDILEGIDGDVATAAFFAGILITPSTIPFFVWLWRSLKLRPGIDRHLQEGESAPQ